ncbi:uncharacterized protein L199_004856 [Kwoniella botswanensis]|uniref:uncharacterized protein n=1 Tax=Kwoniella botswanensis TaxID=1268659 RepID=UPI00315D5C47
MAPSTPSKKAIMPPPPPPTPRAPSNALVIRQPAGPVVPVLPAGSQASPAGRPRHTVTVQVKEERGMTSSPLTPRRASSTFPTPPSTSLIPRSTRSRILTPSPRRRRSSSTPLWSRAQSSTSTAAFKAKLAEIRSRTSRTRDPHPASGSFHRASRNRFVTVEDDDEEVQSRFWGGEKVRGSTADVAIDLLSDSDESSPSSSPTPSTCRGMSVPQSLVRPLPFPSTFSNATPGPSNSSRSDRAESTFSVASFGSSATPFLRAPTWDDSDQRYGRTYPKDGPPREVAPTAATSSLLSSPIPLPFIMAIGKMSDLISSFQPEIPEEDTKRGNEEKCIMSVKERLSMVMESILNDELTLHDGELMKRLKDELAASDIDLSLSDLSSVIKFFKSTVYQTLKSSIGEFRDDQRYKGNKDSRQSMWFIDFKVYLKFATPTLGDKISKGTMETILLYLQVALNEKDTMKHIVDRLKVRFNNCNKPKTMRLLDAMIDLCASIVNIAFPK